MNSLNHQLKERDQACNGLLRDARQAVAAGFDFVFSSSLSIAAPSA